MTVDERARAAQFGHQARASRPADRRPIRLRAALTTAAMALLISTGDMAPAASASVSAPTSTTVALSTPPSTFPGTTAGKQAQWLVTAVQRHPIPMAQVVAHFDAAYLATLPSAATLNASFSSIKQLQVDAITSSTPTSIGFLVTVNARIELQVNLTVDAKGLISSLHLQPAGPSTTTTTTVAPLPEPVVPGATEIPVGVGSPPLKATLTLPPGKGLSPP